MLVQALVSITTALLIAAILGGRKLGVRIVAALEKIDRLLGKNGGGTVFDAIDKVAKAQASHVEKFDAYAAATDASRADIRERLGVLEATVRLTTNKEHP
jgi:hypothetical protein